MKRTLKTTIATLSLLLITCLLSVSEVRAEEVKINLISKISNKYNLNPKYPNEVDQCILMDVLNMIIYEDNEESQKIKKDLDISQFTKSCNEDNDCSINNEIFTKKFLIYDNKGKEKDVAILFFDKTGQKIGYLTSTIYTLFKTDNSMEYLQEYGQEHFFTLRKNSKKQLEIVGKNYSNINLAVKGCYINFVTKIYESNQ